MKLGTVMLVIGLLGTLFMFLPAVELANADIYSNPWVLAGDIVFFIIFLFGLFRLRKTIRHMSEERYHRR